MSPFNRLARHLSLMAVVSLFVRTVSAVAQNPDDTACNAVVFRDYEKNIPDIYHDGDNGMLIPDMEKSLDNLLRLNIPKTGLMINVWTDQTKVSENGKDTIWYTYHVNFKADPLVGTSQQYKFLDLVMAGAEGAPPIYVMRQDASTGFGTNCFSDIANDLPAPGHTDPPMPAWSLKLIA